MRYFLLFFLLLTGACGFSPLYQTSTTGTTDLSVKVAPIPNQYGLGMRQILESKLGISAEPTYLLTVSEPRFFQWDRTIDDKNFTTIMGISGTVSYQLTQGKKTILNNTTSLTSSYSVVKDPYATTVAERKVKKELSELLAEQVSLHVLGTLSGVRD